MELIKAGSSVDSLLLEEPTALTPQEGLGTWNELLNETEQEISLWKPTCAHGNSRLWICFLHNPIERSSGYTTPSATVERPIYQMSSNLNITINHSLEENWQISHTQQTEIETDILSTLPDAQKSSVATTLWNSSRTGESFLQSMTQEQNIFDQEGWSYFQTIFPTPPSFPEIDGEFLNW